MLITVSLFSFLNLKYCSSSSLLPCPVSQWLTYLSSRRDLFQLSCLQFASLCLLPCLLFTHSPLSLAGCFLAVQDKCVFLLLLPSSLQPRFPCFTPRLLTTSFCLPFSHPHTLQISSAHQLLLFLQLAAARLHLLHVSA